MRTRRDRVPRAGIDFSISHSKHFSSSPSNIGCGQASGETKNSKKKREKKPKGTFVEVTLTERRSPELTPEQVGAGNFVFGHYFDDQRTRTGRNHTWPVAMWICRNMATVKSVFHQRALKAKRIIYATVEDRSNMTSQNKPNAIATYCTLRWKEEQYTQRK